MELIERLKEMEEAGELANDGSLEHVALLEKTIEEQKHVEKLLNNPYFKTLIETFKSDLKTRMETLLSKDPEAVALKHMLERTLGKKIARKKLEESISEFIES